METREDLLATELGLPRNKLAKLRKGKLTINVDYHKVDGYITYTSTGINAVKEQFASLFDNKNIASDVAFKKAEHKLLLPPKDLIVTRVPRNTRILICNDKTIVHVRDNTKFIIGMKIEAKQVGSMLEYFGKLPRFKGVY